MEFFNTMSYMLQCYISHGTIVLNNNYNLQHTNKINNEFTKFLIRKRTPIIKS